jgi:methylated-DNA-[protein]-cysteine S-methyltransferase
MNKELYFASDTISKIKFDIVVSSAGIRKILINKNSEDFMDMKKINPENSLVVDVFKQLKEYFKRERKEFDLRLEIIGTEFQKRVWKELLNIPYGKTITYNQLAINLGDKKVIRAAASANGANPLPIVIPCHRVIGSDENLVGYGGSLDVKQKLLELEGSWTLDMFRKE